MIWIGIAIHNPFSKQSGWSSSFGDREWSLTENKMFEFHMMPTGNLLDFTLGIRFWGQDHAGSELELGLFGYSVNVAIRDKRHWYDDENRWYLPGEEQRLTELERMLDDGS